MKEHFNIPSGKAWDLGHWIKLLNVDKPGKNIDNTHQSRDFERRWAEERTYKRWEEEGTFYGFNYHCGAMVGPPIDEPLDEPPICQHFGQMYFDQVLLLLYIRVALFRFSMELNRISVDALKGKRRYLSRWREDFQRLRWSFALFANLYQFPLLSNQQQGIEMYSLARDYLDVDDLFREVKEEINDCHEYLVVREEMEQSSKIERLTRVATIGLGLSIAFGFWGINIIVPGYLDRFCSQFQWLLLFISLVISLVLLSAMLGVLNLARKLERKLRRRK